MPEPRQTAFMTIEYHKADAPLIVDLRKNGLPDTMILKALKFAAEQFETDMINRAIIACKTRDLDVINEYLRAQVEIEQRSIGDIIG